MGGSSEPAVELDAPQTLPAEALPVGCKLNVCKVMDNETMWRQGEVLASRTTANGDLEFYSAFPPFRSLTPVHYVNFNKRLDEWVGVDKMDLTTVRVPKKAEPKQAAPSTKKKLTKAERAALQRQSVSASPAPGESPSATPVPAVDKKRKMAILADDATDRAGTFYSVVVSSPDTPEGDNLTPEKRIKSKEEELESLRHGTKRSDHLMQADR